MESTPKDSLFGTWCNREERQRKQDADGWKKRKKKLGKVPQRVYFSNDTESSTKMFKIAVLKN